eukprot:GHVU01150654.1.p1 GENE.GHVU01150654.1~~GHVU01150654.1.p1  ORF type:complete len:141 (+),score=19.41 GHVU01150654.1:1-423(+)
MAVEPQQNHHGDLPWRKDRRWTQSSTMKRRRRMSGWQQNERLLAKARGATAAGRRGGAVAAVGRGGTYFDFSPGRGFRTEPCLGNRIDLVQRTGGRDALHVHRRTTAKTIGVTGYRWIDRWMDRRPVEAMRPIGDSFLLV